MSFPAVASPMVARQDPVTRLPGAVRVRERAIDKTVRQSAASAIGVLRDDVDVEVSEWGGGLAIKVAAKLPIADLEDTEALRASTSIIDWVRELQLTLAGELSRLTGWKIKRVSFVVTGATVRQRRRVR